MLFAGNKHPTIDYSKKRIVRLKRYKLKWNCVSGYVFFVYQVSTFSSNETGPSHREAVASAVVEELIARCR
jgi:hypothetical protein